VLIMQPHWSRATCFAAMAGCALATQPAIANEYKIVADGAAVLIKIYDPVVGGTQTIFGAKSGVSTPCGLTTNGEFEAFHCGGGNASVIVLSEKFLELVGSRFGKEAIAATVAHEFGHARQYWKTGFTDDKIWTEVVDELQADCVAGVYMKRAAPFPLSEQQVDNVSNFMKAIGDYAISERDWHGTPQMRSVSFRFGYRTGNLDNCLASDSMNWGKIGERIEKEVDKAPETIDSIIKWGKDILK